MRRAPQLHIQLRVRGSEPHSLRYTTHGNGGAGSCPLIPPQKGDAGTGPWWGQIPRTARREQEQEEMSVRGARPEPGAELGVPPVPRGPPCSFSPSPEGQPRG